MTSQADKDWEEYQLGQQGTNTGSMHNQQGLSDRYQPSSSTPTHAKKNTKQAASNNSQAEEHVFNFPIGVISFIVTFFYLYNPTIENTTESAIAAGIAGLVVGRFYKVIIIFVVVIIGFYIFGET
jgi:hypothetical protein